MSTQQATDVFAQLIEQAKERTASLSLYLEDHMNLSPDDVNWANVGDVGYVLENLTEILVYLGLEMER